MYTNVYSLLQSFLKSTITTQMWRHIMLRGAYIASDNYNNLCSLLRLLLICVIFKFYAYSEVGSL